MATRLSELLGGLPAMRQVRALSALQKQLDAVLPVRFRGEAQVVALEEGELRVLCSNGAIASRLRLEAQSLAEAMQQRGLAIRRVSLKVQPANSRKPPAPRAKAPLPAAARQAFESASEQLDEGEVKAALRRLLRHHQAGQ
jgi:hypothetical protein